MPRKKVVDETAGQDAAAIISEEGIDQYDLPRAAILKLARQKLPDNAIIRKDAHTALVKACPVFINYLVAMAHEIATTNKGGARKKVNANDILDAVEQLEFPKAMSKELSKQLDAYRALKSDGPKKKAPPPKAQQSVAPESQSEQLEDIRVNNGGDVEADDIEEGEDAEEDESEEDTDADEGQTDEEDDNSALINDQLDVQMND